eukprot:1149669-Pelagomonas_calceolata.AAC.8
MVHVCPPTFTTWGSTMRGRSEHGLNFTQKDGVNKLGAENTVPGRTSSWTWQLSEGQDNKYHTQHMLCKWHTNWRLHMRNMLT